MFGRDSHLSQEVNLARLDFKLLPGYLKHLDKCKQNFVCLFCLSDNDDAMMMSMSAAGALTRVGVARVQWYTNTNSMYCISEP